MEWKQLISNKRFGQEHKHAERHDDRSEFKRDYDRLIFSSAFRRLQNKTQVFPLPGSIFVHNRLTHSLEVAHQSRPHDGRSTPIQRRKNNDLDCSSPCWRHVRSHPVNSNAPTPLLLPASLHGASPGIPYSEAAGMPRLSFHDQSGHCTEAGFLQTRYLIYFYYP